ncbi:hypothetical protein [Streptomyces sp. SudanB182_2057]|uniref:hypothetical protein n=1 Tax=Streptomyces sp. SudanB182_2057 TaxID=3035281 RepID=UPI003F568F72
MKPRLFRRPVRALSVAAAGCGALLALCLPASASPAPSTAAARTVAADPVESGKPYYTVDTRTDRGLTFEPYMNWDYVLLTNSPGRGTPLVFDKQSDGTYTIRSTSSNWGGYTTWCAVGDGVKLDKPSSCATHFTLKARGDGSYYIGQPVSGGANYATYPVGGKGWIKMFASVLPNFREFGQFKFTAA